MNEFGIVFNHHDVSAAAVQNLEALRRHNPGVAVYSVSADEPFPGGFRIGDLGEGGAVWKAWTRGIQELEWRHCDWLSYAWLLADKASRCRRWIFVGWDVYSTMPLREFIGTAWERPVAGVEVFRPGRDDWWDWFREAVPPSLEKHKGGICPLCFWTCDQDAGRKIAELALRHKDWDGFCELRLGTFARGAGYEPAVIPDARKSISWKWEDWALRGPGVWHPVKTVVSA